MSNLNNYISHHITATGGRETNPSLHIDIEFDKKKYEQDIYYQKGQKDLATTIYNIIDKGIQSINYNKYTDYQEAAHCFDRTLTEIYDLVKRKK